MIDMGNLDFTVFSELATAVGVVVAAIALWLSKRQGQTAFEDSFAREYRELSQKLPTKALLGEALTNVEHARAMDEFYHYFDLCNTQVFHFQQGRISQETWTYWCDGICANLRRPAFRRAWCEIASKAPNDFKELRSVCPPCTTECKCAQH
jgi:hypothetical protein